MHEPVRKWAGVDAFDGNRQSGSKSALDEGPGVFAAEFRSADSGVMNDVTMNGWTREEASSLGATRGPCRGPSRESVRRVGG